MCEYSNICLCGEKKKIPAIFALTFFFVCVKKLIELFNDVESTNRTPSLMKNNSRGGKHRATKCKSSPSKTKMARFVVRIPVPNEKLPMLTMNEQGVIQVAVDSNLFQLFHLHEADSSPGLHALNSQVTAASSLAGMTPKYCHLPKIMA